MSDPQLLTQIEIEKTVKTKFEGYTTSWIIILKYRIQTDLLSCCKEDEHAYKAIEQSAEIAIVWQLCEQVVAEDSVYRDNKEYEDKHVKDWGHRLQDLTYAATHTSQVSCVHQEYWT